MRLEKLSVERECAMRRMTLTLVALGLLVFGGSQVAMAHGYPGHGYRPAYRGNYWAGYPYARGAYVPYTARYGGGYGAGCGVGGAAVPYAAGYGAGYGYPQAGFGVAGRNFSLWFNQ